MKALIKTVGLISLVLAGSVQAASIDMRRDANPEVTVAQDFDFDALANNVHIQAVKDYVEQQASDAQLPQQDAQQAAFTYQGQQKHAFSIQNQAYVEHADDSWPLLSFNIQDGKLSVVQGSDYDADFSAGRFSK